MYDVSSAAKKNIKNFVQLIDYIKQKIALQTPPEAIQTILKSIDYENYLIKEFGETDAQDRMANIGQLINTASNFSTPGIE
jgi:superfamily I DNA/RNA helicase